MYKASTTKKLNKLRHLDDAWEKLFLVNRSQFLKSLGEKRLFYVEYGSGPIDLHF